MAEEHKLEGNRLLKAGKLQEAIAAYSQAIEVDPSVAAYWSNRSQALKQSGDHAGALHDAEEAVRLQPNWSKAHYRRALSLKELGRPAEGVEACCKGLEVTTNEAEVKELNALREKLLATKLVMDAEAALAGPWHGTVSKVMGAYEQEFTFSPGCEMRISVESSGGPAKYALSKLEAQPNGDLRGTLNVTQEGAPDPTPFLFRIDSSDKNKLHLCCPMVQTLDAPRTFDGPGYVAMRRGSKSGGVGGAISDLSEGEQVLRYLEDLSKALEDQVPETSSGGNQTAERLLEADQGTVRSQDLVGQETLEDKGKRMAHENNMKAISLRYSEDIDKAAKDLISRKVDPAKAYPAQAKELATSLRRFRHEEKGNRPSKAEVAAKHLQVKDTESPDKGAAAAAAVAALPAAAVATAEVPASEPAPVVSPVKAPTKAAATASSSTGCCGCFAGLK